MLRSATVQAAYILNNGVDLYNSNYPNAFSGALPQFTPFDRITPGIGELEMITNNAHSTYNALQLQARKILPVHGLQFQANYTWAKNLADADAVWSSGGSNGGIVPSNPLCVSCERGLSSYGIGQRFVGNMLAASQNTSMLIDIIDKARYRRTDLKGRDGSSWGIDRRFLERYRE